MTDTRIHPVILCGGSGTRLWPASTPARPKPFLPLLGESSLFQQTLARTADPALFAPPLVVAGGAHVGLIEEQWGAGEAGARIAVEPAARNTAPAIALAAALLPAEAVMLVCPSDHHIADQAAFRAATIRAAGLAREGWLVAFGITPDRAETGYGYLKRGTPLGEGAWRIDQFVEKPDQARAEAFLADGQYDWNGGLFAFTAGAFMAELGRQRPEMAALVAEAVAAGQQKGALFHPAPAPFAAITGESVDYAVMEGAGRAAMVPAAMGWSDIGSWRALHEARGSDAAGNYAAGRADLADSRNVMVDSDGPRVSVVGLDNVIVVVRGGEVLVTSAEGAQAVGRLPGARGE